MAKKFTENKGSYTPKNDNKIPRSRRTLKTENIPNTSYKKENGTCMKGNREAEIESYYMTKDNGKYFCWAPPKDTSIRPYLWDPTGDKNLVLNEEEIWHEIKRHHKSKAIEDNWNYIYRNRQRLYNLLYLIQQGIIKTAPVSREFGFNYNNHSDFTKLVWDLFFYSGSRVDYTTKHMRSNGGVHFDTDKGQHIYPTGYKKYFEKKRAYVLDLRKNDPKNELLYICQPESYIIDISNEFNIIIQRYPKIPKSIKSLSYDVNKVKEDLLNLKNTNKYKSYESMIDYIYANIQKVAQA